MHAHFQYAIFLENQRKQALLKEEEKKGGLKRVEQRNSKSLHEQLAEQAQLETVQMGEQETARQLILEATKKLSEVVQGTEQSTRCKGCTAAKCRLLEVD